MKKVVTVVFALVLVFAMAGCASNDGGAATPTKNPTTAPSNSAAPTDPQTEDAVNIDLANGKASTCFDDLRDNAETLAVETVKNGETKNYSFEGVYLKDVLAKLEISTYTKIELVVSDSDEKVDMTDAAKSEAGVFLAWSNDGKDETPMRVLPADATTGNQLYKNVTVIIVTK